jgi:hypothetical protein
MPNLRYVDAHSGESQLPPGLHALSAVASLTHLTMLELRAVDKLSTMQTSREATWAGPQQAEVHVPCLAGPSCLRSQLKQLTLQTLTVPSHDEGGA